MASILFKWLLFPLLLSGVKSHPIYVSVVEMEHNAKEQSIELTCRIFTDDFEKTLREDNGGVKIDLLAASEYDRMCPLVSRYVKTHLKIRINGKPAELQFKGFEQVEEAIYSYYEIRQVPAVKELSIENDILYSYKKEQMGIFHVTVNGERKSTRLVNPEKKAELKF